VADRSLGEIFVNIRGDLSKLQGDFDKAKKMGEDAAKAIEAGMGGTAKRTVKSAEEVAAKKQEIEQRAQMQMIGRHERALTLNQKFDSDKLKSMQSATAGQMQLIKKLEDTDVVSGNRTLTHKKAMNQQQLSEIQNTDKGILASKRAMNQQQLSLIQQEEKAVQSKISKIQQFENQMAFAVAKNNQLDADNHRKKLNDIINAEKASMSERIKSQDKAAAAMMQSDIDLFNRKKKVSDDYAQHDAAARNYQANLAKKGEMFLGTQKDQLNTEQLKTYNQLIRDGIAPKQAWAKTTGEMSEQATFFGHNINSLMKRIILTHFALQALYGTLNAVKQGFLAGLAAVEDYELKVASMSAFLTTFNKNLTATNAADIYKASNAEAQNLVKTMEILDARTIASGKDLTTMAEQFIKGGVKIDTANKGAMDGFVNIANALKLLTKGQNQEIQMRQEIRALTQGQVRDQNILVQTLKGIDPNIKEHIKLWKQQGTVLENVGQLLAGFGPAAKELENTWAVVGSTMETVHNRVLRDAFRPTYEALIQTAKTWNSLLVDSNGNLTTFAKTLQDVLSGTLKLLEVLLKIAIPLALFAAFVSVGKLIELAIWGAAAAMEFFTAAAMKNPIILGATLLGAAILYFYDFTKAADAATEKTKKMNDEVERIGASSNSVGEFQDALANLREEANKKLNEDSWWYQVFVKGNRGNIPTSFADPGSPAAARVRQPPPVIPRGKTFDDVVREQQNNAWQFGDSLKPTPLIELSRNEVSEHETALRKGVDEARRANDLRGLTAVQKVQYEYNNSLGKEYEHYSALTSASEIRTASELKNLRLKEAAREDEANATKKATDGEDKLNREKIKLANEAFQFLQKQSDNELSNYKENLDIETQLLEAQFNAKLIGEDAYLNKKRAMQEEDIKNTIRVKQSDIEKSYKPLEDLLSQKIGMEEGGIFDKMFEEASKTSEEVATLVQKIKTLRDAWKFEDKGKENAIKRLFRREDIEQIKINSANILNQKEQALNEEQKLLDAYKSKALISDNDYWDKTRLNQERGMEVQVENLQKQLSASTELWNDAYSKLAELGESEENWNAFNTADKEVEALNEQIRILLRQLEQFRKLTPLLREDTSNWVKGAKQGFREYANDANNAFNFAQSAAKRAFSSMEDAIVDFVKTGKLSFKSMIDGMIADLTRLVVRMGITNKLAAAFGGSGEGGTLGGGIAALGGALVVGSMISGPSTGEEAATSIGIGLAGLTMEAYNESVGATLASLQAGTANVAQQLGMGTVSQTTFTSAWTNAQGTMSMEAGSIGAIKTQTVVALEGSGLANSISNMSSAAFTGWSVGIGTFLLALLRGAEFKDAALQGIGAGLGAWAGAAGGTAVATFASIGGTWGNVIPVIGGIIGAAVGGLIGLLIGGGGKENTFTLTELVNQGIVDTVFEETEGLKATLWSHGPASNGWYIPVANAYASVIGVANEAFTNMVFDFAGKMPETLGDLFVKEIAATDFTSILTEASSGRWGISGAQGAIEGIAQKYVDLLSTAANEAYNKAIAQFMQVGDPAQLLGPELAKTLSFLTEVAQAQVKSLFVKAGEAIATGGLEAGLTEAGKISEEISKISEAMAPIQEIIDTENLSDLEKDLRNINKQFDDYSEQLKSAGVDLEKYTDLEKARGIVLRQNIVPMVTSLYQENLGRDPDAEGLAFWVDALTSEMYDVSDVIKEMTDIMVNGAEYMAFKLRDINKQVNKSIEDTINSLMQGSLAPVQSVEFFARRYEGLLEEAQGARGTEEYANKVSNLTSFIPQFLEFSGAYGENPYKDLFDRIIGELGDLKVPGFATGGYHSGGLRVVGEKGPEIEWTGSSQIFNQSQFGDVIADAITKSIGSQSSSTGTGDVIVKVYLGQKELKDVHVQWHRTDSETHSAVRREVAA